MRARRLKLPVLSRLAWAWLCFIALTGAVAAYSMLDDGRTSAAAAMAIEGIERLAPPLASPPERLAAAAPAEPEIAEAPEEPYGADAEDIFADAGDIAILREDPAADIIITVDGAPARAIGATPASSLAALPTIAAPDAALLRRSAYGQIPRVSADGRRPSAVYAQKFDAGDAPNVALIVGGLGLNRALTERAIDELPPQVTLAFAPYSKDLVFWTKRARDAGHEVMLEIPMENRTGDAETLGPAALLTSRTPEENQQRLEWLLSRFQGYFGVTNYLGAKFSGDREAMELLLRRIHEAGLAYVDDTGALSRLSHKGEAAIVNRVIDPGYKADGAQTKRDLQTLEEVARRDGKALGKTYVHDRSLDVIVTWAEDLKARDLTLAPASAVLAMSGQES